jgi:hypothetical protein
VEVIDAKTEQNAVEERFDRNLADVIPVQSEIAARIADALEASGEAANGEQSRMKKRPTDNMAAYDLSALRRFQLARTGFKRWSGC